MKRKSGGERLLEAAGVVVGEVCDRIPLPYEAGVDIGVQDLLVSLRNFGTDVDDVEGWLRISSDSGQKQPHTEVGRRQAVPNDEDSVGRAESERCFDPDAVDGLVPEVGRFFGDGWDDQSLLVGVTALVARGSVAECRHVSVQDILAVEVGPAGSNTSSWSHGSFNSVNVLRGSGGPTA